MHTRPLHSTGRPTISIQQATPSVPKRWSSGKRVCEVNMISFGDGGSTYQPDQPQPQCWSHASYVDVQTPDPAHSSAATQVSGSSSCHACRCRGSARSQRAADKDRPGDGIVGCHRRATAGAKGGGRGLKRRKRNDSNVTRLISGEKAGRSSIRMQQRAVTT